MIRSSPYASANHVWRKMGHAEVQAALHADKPAWRPMSAAEVREADRARRAYEARQRAEERANGRRAILDATAAQGTEVTSLAALGVPEVKPVQLARLAYAGDWE